MAGNPRTFNRGQIMIYRNGVPFRNYGDTRITTDDYGTGFLAACAALADDDILVLGPGVYTTVNATIAAARVHVIANGTVIKRKTATNYTHLLKVTGNDCIIDGLKVNGGGASNTGSGLGFWVTGDRCQLRNVSAISTRGTTVDNGDGSTIKIDDCTDTVLDGFYSYDAEYAGLWLNKTPRCYVNNVYCVDAQNRSLSINSSIDIDLITVSNFTAIAVTAGCSSTWNTNIDFEKTLGELRMTKISLTDTDMVGAGVSAADDFQLFKFQNINKLVMDGVVLKHGTSTAGASRSIMFQDQENGEDNTPPNELIMNDCSFSSTIRFDLTFPHISATNCHFGTDVTDYGVLFYLFKADYAKFDRCIFDSKADTYAIHLDSAVTAADRYEFTGCKFKSDSASSTYCFNHNAAIDLTTMACAFLFDQSNTLENVGAGTMYRTNNVHGNLILTTDLNGDMLFDDTLIGTNEVQSIARSAGVSGGTFTLSYGGDTTSALAYNISAASLKTAIEGLTGIDLVSVTGSGSIASPWLVEFQGKLDSMAITAMTSDSTLLVGGTVTVTDNATAAVSLGKHPHPGDGPAYFPGLDVPDNGRRIWNVNWSPDATQIVTERGWIAHNGEWKEIT